MPTTTQMLAKAEELEARARAIRMTIVEMNGDLREAKQARVGTTIEQAIGLRREQQGTSAPGLNKLERLKRRVELVRELLATKGPQRSVDIRRYLQEQGVGLTKDGFVAFLRAQVPEAERTGRTARTIWTLKAPPSAPPMSRPRAPVKKPRHKTPTFSRDEIRAHRAESAKLLEHFSTTAGLTNEEMRAAGLSANDIRKLGGLFRHGYLKRKGERYYRTAKTFTP